MGLKEILEQIVEKVPAPTGDVNTLQATVPLIRFEEDLSGIRSFSALKEMQIHVIDLEQDSGQSLFSHASLIERQELFDGIAAVPLESLSTLYILAFLEIFTNFLQKHG